MAAANSPMLKRDGNSFWFGAEPDSQTRYPFQPFRNLAQLQTRAAQSPNRSRELVSLLPDVLVELELILGSQSQRKRLFWD